MLEVIDLDGRRVKLSPRPIPAAFEPKRTGRDIILKPRQIGMTIWELARDVWFFLTRPGAHVVVVCQSMADDAAIKEIADKISVMLEALRSEIGLAFPVQPQGGTQWVLPARRSKLRVVGAGASEASASKKGRSGTIHRLHITELAFFEYGRTTLTAILQSVPAPKHGTEIVIESTPNGAVGPFYDRYQAAKLRVGGYSAHFFPWYQHSLYQTPLDPGESLEPETTRERELVERYGGTPEQLKWYRAKVGENGQDLADQEYPIDEETCWLAEGRLFFDKHRTSALLADSKPPTDVRHVGSGGSFGTFKIWSKPEQGRSYIIVADPSEGVGGDPGAAVVYERSTGTHVATLHGQFTPWEMARLLAGIAREYNEALLIIERNNHGHAVLLALGRDPDAKYENLYKADDDRLGWDMKQISRATALEGLHDAHREKRWATPERETLDEMLHFIVPKDGKPQAAPGAHDDRVMAHTIAWDVLTKPILVKQRHEVYDYDDTNDADG